MRILYSSMIIIFLSSCLLPAQQSKSIYKLPESSETVSATVTSEVESQAYILVGAESGLYKVSSSNVAFPLWTEGKVKQIIHLKEKNAKNGPGPAESSERWFFLTSKGVLTSTDLITFEFRNNGLPFLTVKEYDGTNTSFRQQIHQLKDLAVHPTNHNILVTATKDRVYLTRDGGLNWSSLGLCAVTAGVKAVAVADMNVPGSSRPASVDSAGNPVAAKEPDRDLVVFMSHPIYGLSYKLVDAKKPEWVDCTAGFDVMQTQTYPDEIADILPVVFMGSDGFPTTEIFLSQTYLPKLYRFDWAKKRGELLYTGNEPVDTIDGLFWDGRQLLYTRPGEVAAFKPSTGRPSSVPESYSKWQSAFSALAPNDTLYAALIPNNSENVEGQTADVSEELSLSELWLLQPEKTTNIYAPTAIDKKSVYVPANHVVSQEGIDKFKKILKDNKLNSLVIDMKDDYGLLRYETKDPLVLEKTYISRYHIDIDHFVSEFKKDNTYLIARIVTFKDKHLASIKGGKYAVWDRVTNKPWVGTRGMKDVKNEAGEVIGQEQDYYDENWVDPYCPEVWEYTIHIAQELIARGFDEIQFDYIRFPTDGYNIGHSSFRYQSPGMDKESALVSFLSYARKNIDAPIGIDIYGANGWYRTGARTGQDVELLAEYVDVICPMFYPSHFENSFLNYAPYSERPYRIYYYGTYRNTVIGRNKIIVRPWVQAFYIGVPYDRQWYGSEYVQKEIFGVRDSVDKGYMYWNNIGRYDDISPDVGSAEYTGPAIEASTKYRKPALSGGKKESPVEAIETSVQNDVSILDTIRKQEKAENKKAFPSLSEIKKLWQAYAENGA